MGATEPGGGRSLPNAAELARRWTLVAPHRDDLLAVARRRCPTPQDAEDCVHEAMVRAVAYPQLDPARVARLLTAITMRVSADAVRRRGAELRGRPRLILVPHQMEPPDEAVADHYEALWLAEQVARLPERERQVFERRVAGLSVGETASLLQLSYKSVEGAFTRARKRLRGWAAAVALLLGARLWRTRRRHVMTALGLFASAGCAMATGGVLRSGHGNGVGATHGGAGAMMAPGAAAATRSDAPATAHVTAAGPRAAGTPASSGATGWSGSGGGGAQQPSTVSFHTGPVEAPGTTAGVSDAGLDLRGNPVSGPATVTSTVGLR